MPVVIKIENLGKRYRLGDITRRMLYEDVQRRWAKFRGKEDPYKLVNDRKGSAPKAAEEIWALQDVNFDVQEGEVVGIIGRNGSGKSTLLKILSKITAPTQGRALIKGRVASLLEVGTGFHPELTGRENVYMNASILGMTKQEIDGKFDEIVEFSGVEKFIDTPVKRYSSGMMVRLAFAVAAHLEPEIMIIDEVLAVGDSAFQQKCLGRMSAVAREGRTVLFVSHNTAAVENLCTRGVVLDQGRVSFDGTQTAALEYYTEQSAKQIASLRDRRDRGGLGDIRIVAIECRNAEGREVKTVASGQDMELCLFFENHTHREFPTLNARIHIANQFEMPVFVQHNALSGETFGPLPASGAFVCRIPRLPLPAGHYRISYYISSGYYRGCDQLDNMTNAIEMVVEGGDFFGRGEMPSAGEGACLVPAQWRLEEMQQASSSISPAPLTRQSSHPYPTN